MRPLDIENIMRQEVGALVDVPCCAPPIPNDLSAPQVLFQRVGGSVSDLVVDEHNVQVHVWANDWAEAQTIANDCVEAVKKLPIMGGAVNASAINSLPYNNFDPNHQGLARVTFLAIVTCRSER